MDPEELDYQGLDALSHRTLRKEGEGNVPRGRRRGPAAAAGCRGGLHRRTAPVGLGSRGEDSLLRWNREALPF